MAGTVPRVGVPVGFDDDREPPAERVLVRRGGGVVGRVALAAVALGAVVLWWSGRGGDEVAAPPITTSPSTTPTTAADPDPAPVVGGRVARTGGDPVAGLRGSLVFSGRGGTSVWVAPLDGSPVRRIDGPDLVVDLHAREANPAGPTVVRETVVWAADGGVWALPVGELASGIAVGVGVGGLEAPVVATVPAADRRSVWVHTRPAGADVFWRLDVVTLAPRARVVLGDGETGRPSGLALVGATDRGPLVRWPGAGDGAGLWSLDEDGGPHTPLGLDARVVAAGAGAVVVDEGDVGSPALVVVDPADGRAVPLDDELLPGTGVAGGAVSPDGDRLALWSSGRPDSPGELVVLSLAGGAAVVESRRKMGPTVVDVVWSPDGDAAAVVDVDLPRRWRVRAYRVADGAVVALPVVVEGAPDAPGRAPTLVGFTAG